MRQPTLFTLQVTILDGPMTDASARANPVISRTIEIRSQQTLNQLHRAIFEAFDRWDDCHLCEFHFGSKPRERHAKCYVLPFIYDDPEEFDEPMPAGSITQTRIGSLGLTVGSVFWYWYDFGDNWYHEIRVLEIGEVETKVKYPRLIARVGDSPPQYVNWDEEELYLDEEPPPADWLGEALQYGEAVLDVESGLSPCGDGVPVPWIRYQVAGNTVALARELAQQMGYQVTTLQHHPDGTGELTTYLVSGQYLDSWLGNLLRSGEVTVLSVEMM